MTLQNPAGGEAGRAYGATAWPAPGAVLELFKPITWFPPMWAFACGLVSTPASIVGHWPLALGGVVLAGPLLCAMSQAVNDWFDREVDAINEPQRPIPSGRIPGRWGLGLASAWTLLSLAVAATLGRWVFAAALAGTLLAWAYSAPPLRLKRNGWLGNAACGLSYEGLAWITGASLLAANGRPAAMSLVLALLYSAGAHGIMTLNDFKSIEGDRRTGIDSLPVQLGAQGAARVAALIMALSQLMVVMLLAAWGHATAAVLVSLLLAGQLVMMRRFLRDPVRHALWYSGFGVPLFVSGMMVCAFALRLAA